MIKQKGFLSTCLTSVLIVSITVITHVKRHLFMDGSMETNVVELAIVILSIALIFRVPFVRVILAGCASIFLFYIAVMAIESPSDFYLVPRAIMFLVLLFVWYMLLFEEAVKIYVSHKANGRLKVLT